MHSLALHSVHVVQCNNRTKEKLSRKNDYFLKSLGDVYMKLLLILPENGCWDTGTAEVFNLKEYLSLFFYNTIFDLIMLNCK